MGSPAKFGDNLQSAVETLDCFLDAVEHIAPELVLRNDGDNRRGVLASDLAWLVTEWPGWLDIVRARSNWLDVTQVDVDGNQQWALVER